MSTKPLFSILLCSIFIALASSGNCFWIDGNVARNRTPCFDLNVVGASMCCNKHNSNFTKCTSPGGICTYTYPSGAQGLYDQGLSFWRDSCSDPTWRDPACVAMAPYVKSAAVRLNKCEDGTFCPRNTDDLNTTCCDNHQGQSAGNNGAKLPRSTMSSTEDPGVAGSTSTSVSASLSSSASSLNPTTPTSTTTTSASVPTRASPGDGTKLNNAAEVATILSGVVGFFALLAIVVSAIYKWRKRRSRQHQRLNSYHLHIRGK